MYFACAMTKPVVLKKLNQTVDNGVHDHQGCQAGDKGDLNSQVQFAFIQLLVINRDGFILHATVAG